MEITTAADADADTDADADADAVMVGAADVHESQPRPPLSTAGPTVTAEMEAKNAHTLLMDTRRKPPSPTWWAAAPIGDITLLNDR